MRTEGTFTPDKDGIYRGNQTDVGAMMAALLGLITLASCFGGLYCLPILGLILGVVAYRGAQNAIDSQRTKVLAIIGMVTGGLFVFAIFAVISLYVGIFVLAAASAGGFP